MFILKYFTILFNLHNIQQSEHLTNWIHQVGSDLFVEAMVMNRLKINSLAHSLSWEQMLNSNLKLQPRVSKY